MRFKVFHTLQFHSFCIETQSTQQFRETFVLILEKSTYFAWFENSFVPWGQSRWKCEQNLKHLIKKAHPDAYLPRIQQMLRPSNLAALFAAACSLTHPSGNVKGLLYVPLLHGLKYDWQSYGDGSVHYIPLVFLAIPYSNTQLKKIEHWAMRSRSCQPFLTWAVVLVRVLYRSLQKQCLVEVGCLFVGEVVFR